MMEFNGSFNSVLTDEAGDLVVSFTVGRADGHAAKECIEQMRAWASVGKNQLDIRLQPKKAVTVSKRIFPSAYEQDC